MMLQKIMRLRMPEFIKKKKLNELFRLTADAFRCELPELKGLSFAECLSEYAIFTKEQAESYLQSGRPPEELKQRLYQNSYIFGQGLRRSLHIITWEEAVTVLTVIYKLMGIDFQYDRQGEFIIKQCFFSKYYSGEVCKLISSLDEGLAAGVSGGGRLCFKQRITEGGSCCKGYFSRES
ncbi:MAG: L-2-amino-thiazoline-4-carboxylic acid hydrolase [Dehalobacter sp.]|nr:L-2-amino-thiazoline-4-carboxylic acid hydrolase [Dehalobacter sp.]